MLSLALGLTLLHAQVQPPRLRTILPNGATILVEPVTSAREVSIQLWISSRGLEERPETHGLRHVLEHIIALGPNRDLDRRLEFQGGMLRARTFRDATQIEVQVPPGRLASGLEAISEMLGPIRATPEQVLTETKIIDQELGLLTDDADLNSAAWSVAYGDSALDPFGDPEVMHSALPADLEAIHKRGFVAPNMAIVIVGPVDLDDATGKARAILGALPKVAPYPARVRPEGHGGQTSVRAFGEARAAIVPDFSTKQAMSALAAALAIASRQDDCFVTYTPSVQNGLVILGRTDSNQGLEAYIDGLDQGTMASLFAPGKALARGWVDRQLHSPSAIGYVRGLLLCQDAGSKPEEMFDAIQSMTFNDFVAGVQALQKDKAVSVSGSEQ